MLGANRPPSRFEVSDISLSRRFQMRSPVPSTSFDQNDDDFETIWQTESCYCHGEVLDVSIEDYHIIESPTNQEL